MLSSPIRSARRPDRPGDSRRTGRRVAALLSTALGISLVAVTMPGAADAAVPKPAGSHVQLLMDSTSPTAARWSGDWVGDQQTIVLADGYTKDDLGCPDTDYLEFAWTTASTDGSTEEPAVSDDNATPAFDAYPWIGLGSAAGDPQSPYLTVADTDFTLGPSNLDQGTNYLSSVFGAFGLYTADSWPAKAFAFANDTDAGSFLSAPRPDFFTPGNEVSLVMYCAAGFAANGAPLVRSDGSGHAIASWFHVVLSNGTGANDAPGIQPTGYTIVGDQAAPTVQTTATAVTRSVATLNATLTDGSGQTYTDASGELQWYSGDDATAGHEVGDPVAVTAGVAAPRTVDLSGYPASSAQDFVAVYTPDDASSARYTGSTSDVLTLRVGSDAAATTTALAVTGTRTAGQTQTLTATVSPSTATGTVTFTDGNATLGTASVTGGKAELRKALAAGTHSLTAAFTPSDANQFSASRSSATAVTITAPAASTTSIVAPASTYGNAARVTVTVRGGTATGTVRLTGAGTAQTRTLSTGKAIFTLPKTLAVGSHILTATYAGNATTKTSSHAQAIRITKRAANKPTLKITTKPSRRKAGKATVTVGHVSGLAVPTGKVTVTLKLGGTTKKVTGTLKSGKATVTLPKLPKKGTWSVTAAYAGNATYTAKTSSIVKVRVS